MGKRSNFERRERDYYPTPLEAVYPLQQYSTGFKTFIEPCAGDGRLVAHLTQVLKLTCVGAFDIEPHSRKVRKCDAFKLAPEHCQAADCLITNPPWQRTILHPMIVHFSNLRPTFLLFDADWLHTKQAAPYIQERLLGIISVGRVKWIENSTTTGKDNCCWYLFTHQARATIERPFFIPREV